MQKSRRRRSGQQQRCLLYTSYVPTDNTVAANTGIVDGICRPAKKPVFAGEEGICAGCGVATLSIKMCIRDSP